MTEKNKYDEKITKCCCRHRGRQSVDLKIWRNKKLISKRLTLGRLETSEEFKETKPKIVKKDEEIESLKIAVREINDKDISSRNLNTKTKGVVITDISNRKPSYKSFKCK